MLRITASISAQAAAAYFDQGLKVADYYSSGDKSPSYWGGKGAAMLELSGEIQSDIFKSLVTGHDPNTGEFLGVREKDDRRPGYDFTFSVPKSMSVYLAETGDAKLRASVHDAIKETMADIEGEMKARVRTGGADHDRVTGNMVWGAFEHQVTRPVGGVPDPHLHVHVYAMNLTFDPDESRWKAGQFGDIKKDAPYWQAVFNSRLADKAQALGFGIERTEKNFELSGVPSSVVETFSKRTKEIEDHARKHAVQLEKKARSLMRESGKSYAEAHAEAKAQLGATTRESKKTGDTANLRDKWRAQMTPSELEALHHAKGSESKHLLDCKEAIANAISHAFERGSVARERAILTHALQAGIGGGYTVNDAQQGLHAPEWIKREVNGQTVVTTKEILAEEESLVAMCRAGRGTASAFSSRPWAIKREFLNDEQRAAVAHVISSTDKWTGIRGAAGTGKTTMMQETVEAIESTGRKVYTFAPSAKAAQVLQGEGFKADTVQRLLVDEKLQQSMRGAVLWVDEAGLMSVPDLHKLGRIASVNKCRLVLGGDTAQHRAVQRGDALRLLENEGGLNVAELSKIQRQKRELLRDAIVDFSKGNVPAGFDKLDSLGAIKQIVNEDERNAALVSSYMTKKERGQSVLVIAPTHAEGRIITRALRDELRAQGVIGKDTHAITTLENKGWTEAQRSDAVNYKPGQVIEFHQNSKGNFKRGQQWQVTGIDNGELRVRQGDHQRMLRLDQAKHFAVYETGSMQVSEGDVVRITKNGASLKNNTLHHVTAITQEGITLQAVGSESKPVTLTNDRLHLAHGYAVTSHASQGMTVDNVIIAQSTPSLAVASKEQAYVSASRARYSIEWFTDDKAALRDAVQSSDARISAHDLIKGSPIKPFEREASATPSGKAQTPSKAITKDNELER